MTVFPGIGRFARVGVNWLCLSSLLILPVSCSREGAEWERARQQDTIIAYRNFLASYPSSPHEVEAEARVEELTWRDEATAWEKSQSFNSIEGYRRFLSLFPSGRFHADAATALDRLIWAKEELAWADVVDHNTKEALERFVAHFSASSKLAEANEKIEALDWESAKSADSLAVYEDFAARYPSTSRKTELADAIKRKEYELTLAPASVVAQIDSVTKFLRDAQIGIMEAMNTYVSPENPLLVSFPAKGMPIEHLGRTVTFFGGGIRVSTPDPSVKFVEGTKFSNGEEKAVYRGGAWLRDSAKPKR